MWFSSRYACQCAKLRQLGLWQVRLGINSASLCLISKVPRVTGRVSSDSLWERVIQGYESWEKPFIGGHLCKLAITGFVHMNRKDLGRGIRL